MFRSLRLSLYLGLVATSSTIAAATEQAPAVQVRGLGQGLVHLKQPWQFHLGDDQHWAAAEVNDTSGQDGWESISPERPWGAQRHYAYTGFAWYRLHLDIATNSNSELRLVLSGVGDACEVYWNGTLIGRYGELPPNPSSPALDEPTVFTLPKPYAGTLALRFWKGGLGSSSSGEVGGLSEAPIIGDSESVHNYIQSWRYGFLRGTLFADAMNVLYLTVGMLAFIVWLRRRSEWLLLWFAIFAICPAIWNSLFTLRLGISGQFAAFVLQPLWQVRNVALWFLLIDLLGLRARLSLVRWAHILAVISITAAFLDGCLNYVPPASMTSDTGAWIDGILTFIIAPCTLFLLVIAAYGFRKKHDSVRWVVAVSACLSQLLAVVAAMAQQGQRFTHWTLAQKLYSPLFHIGPVYFTAQVLFDLLVFFSVLYAVYRFVYDQQTRKAILEQELESARELQKVLIPESTPELPGYTISSAYNPALEVGGDFFQIIPLQGEQTGSTLVILGDVSGKGLRAAMAVSLIVGTVRTLAENTSSPARILEGLSRRLFGRLQGGFTTCLAVRLDADGSCTLASAGHPAPYLNEREIDLPGALPLGIDPSIEYPEITMQIHPRDQVTLYTDGLLEARSASGEIFSFNRLQSLVAGSPNAASASAAAIAFGQEDDITVLTVTRSA
jgi:hypothetical protein